MTIHDFGINDEELRCQALRELGLEQPEREPGLLPLLVEAQRTIGVGIAAVTILSSDQQYFVATVGLGGLSKTSRAIAFCDVTIMSDNVPHRRHPCPVRYGDCTNELRRNLLSHTLPSLLLYRERNLICRNLCS